MNISQLFNIAVQSIINNKLRTTLTILGVVVGIFSIIVIMTIITMLQSSIEDGLAMLNKNTFQIQKHEPMQGPGHNRSDRNRKDITIEEAMRLKEVLTSAQYVGAEQWQFGKVVKFGNIETNPNISVAGATVDALRTNDWNVDYGRDLRENDVEYSANVCLLGPEIVDKLFPNLNPVGQTVRVDNQPLKVIGVLQKQPAMFGESRDNYIVMPITTWQSIYGKYGRSVNITVTSPNKESYNDVIEAAIGHFRKIRKVQAGQPDDFYIFSNESMITQFNTISGPIKIGALAVSLVALIAAGVGIMNIMLVSVTERTREIGIRKAIGAKKSSILIQFLIEAVILCIVGGLVGIALGIGIGNFFGSFLNAQMAIPYDWVIIGITMCVIVGLIFGTYPAYKAANLDPIEALRYE
ncbi:MAG: FtsX-like permease family protein [Ignavibacteriota bacterium]|jgi:putative ABC transport system permease protein|nr:ABC transporter permease [Ignavibacteriales bacterium]MBL1121578.1 FtsX-like permease family protein [Ignavibacteriota bacterium]MBV6419360.1 Macrolide export ATP-binding/permease protein MacB [Ignavibacteriaceae bacterium]MCE7855250.1 peptide ABC transporter permease [Ignavibacteria bacterium CHB3]MEB2296089.1 ABC transporter permease [Ignavibacteria bacterium]